MTTAPAGTPDWIPPRNLREAPLPRRLPLFVFHRATAIIGRRLGRCQSEIENRSHL